MDRTQGGELGPFLFGLFIPSTAAFVASHSWQQIFLYSSGIIMWVGKEWRGIGLPSEGEQEALGMWVFTVSWRDWP